MKKTIYIIALILLSFCSCYAQKKIIFNQSIVKGNKQTYKVESLINKYRYVQNVNGRFYNVENHLPPNTIVPEPEDLVIDKLKLDEICHEIFNDERLKQLVEDTNHLQVIFKTDLQGNILDMDFSFKQTSSLTALEIETMESRFKKDLNVKINPKRFTGYTYIPVAKFIFFNRLLKNNIDVVK